MKVHLRAAIAILGMFLGTHAFGGNVVAVVYFVPFEIETYAPITQATIVCQAREKWTVTDEYQVSILNNLLSQGNSATFDAKRVRMKISADNQAYYIDSDGVVLKGKRSFKIDKSAFAKFAQSLTPDQRRTIEQHSCKPK